MLLLQSTLVTTLQPGLQVWGLMADNGDMRVVIINKDDAIHCNMKVWFDDARYCKKPGTLSRLLPGEDGIKSKTGITWQGQTYEGSGYSGKLQGAKLTQQIQPEDFSKMGKCGFQVPVPASSAALLVASKKGIK